MVSFKNSAFICLVLINLIGFISCFVIILNSRIKRKYRKIPEAFEKIFVLIFFAAPIAFLSLAPQPRFELHYTIFVIGIVFILSSTLIWTQAFRQIGIIPGLRRKSKVISSGIYSVVRNPIYLGNIFMPLGLALAFRAIYALLYVSVIIILFAVIIFIEEKLLTEEYGEEYLTYKKKVRWRLIPWLI